MNVDKSRLQELARKWMTGKITPEERIEFMSWYNNVEDGQPLNIPQEFASDELMHSLRIYKNIYEKNKRFDEQAEDQSRRGNRVVFLRSAWVRYAAAIIILLVAVAVFLVNKPSGKNPVIVQVNKVPVHHDIKAPSAVNAVITLSDGSKIILDSLANGTITAQGDVQLTKLGDGQVVYKGNSNEIMYNTLTNPRGSRVIQIILSDGTKVWLNSESSIRYPTAFAGSERVVEVTGETYFEVARNKAMPFRVRKEDMEVTVLGTHFNVNVYKEEEKMRVTLLEGSVDVAFGGTSKIQLKPGEQSQLNDGKFIVAKGVDIDGVMAWKNGKFDFGEKADIGTIMREIARWYNLKLEYKGKINYHFGGSISRDVNLSEVLKVLETTREVKFNVAGSNVIIMP